MNFLKKVFLSINSRLIKPYIDNKYWLLVEEHSKIKVLKNEFLGAEVTRFYPDLDPNRIKYPLSKIDKFVRHRFTRYIYRIDNCIVEPSEGWLILNRNQLFSFSFPMIDDPWDKMKPRPSILSFLTTKFFKKKRVVKIPLGISVRYAWQNYYHFFIDTLPQIMLLDEHGLDPDIPIIVPHFFDELDYVNQFLSKSTTVKRPIIVQRKNEYIRVENLFVAKDVFFSHSINKVSKLVGNRPNSNGPSHLFVTRAFKYGRTIKNINEINEIVDAYTFKTVEPGDYSLEKQVDIFRNAKVIVGIHGAGLTNLIFCQNKSVKFLEIFPGNGLCPEHYRNICKQYNIEYHSIEGEEFSSDGNFVIDAVRFRSKMTQLLS